MSGEPVRKIMDALADASKAEAVAIPVEAGGPGRPRTEARGDAQDASPGASEVSTRTEIEWV